ncbi:hypothetical protein IFM89_034369 [Coptis chinensis]|uniref:RING-type domain-containing protein n=1 Tax=Coptis chinensis TaxID=261450 RepID=A0A835LPD9_9MAGN|nr:hypothetical protein IFM89_034369 [Coptis chinensis]
MASSSTTSTSTSTSSRIMGTHISFQLQEAYYTFNMWEPEEQQPHDHKHKKARKGPEVQFCFEFNVESKCHYVLQKLNGEQVFLSPEQLPTVTKTFTVDPRLFKYRNQLHGSIAYMLSVLNIDKDIIQRTTIEKIASDACRIANSLSSKGRPMLSMHVEIIADGVYLCDQRELLMTRLLRESMVESESRGFGMVPACKTAINELNKVRFDGGDSMISKCTICFDEFEVGSEVTKLPCKHVFHGKCISPWLHTSHLCPICRFKMPVEVN